MSMNQAKDGFQITIADRSQWDEWEAFNLKYGNVFQSIGFATVFEETGTDVKLLLVRRNNVLVGGVLYFFPLSGWKKAFAELRVVSGPVVTDNPVLSCSVLDAILKALIQLAHQHKVVSLNIKTPFSDKTQVLLDNNFIISEDAPTYSFNVQLNKDAAVLRKALDKKTRNAVNKAEKEGVAVNTTEDIDLVYRLYMNRAKDKPGQVPIPKSYFVALKKHIKSHFLVAVHNGKTIAESIFLEYGNRLYYFNNGSLPESWKLNPNTLLVWKIIENNAGLNKLLNLYGVPSGDNKDHPVYGIYKFKSGFGGALVDEFTFASMIISPKKKWLFDKAKNMFLPIYKRLISR